MSKKYEDGIWLFKGTDGYARLRFVKDGYESPVMGEGELYSPSALESLPWTPIRRVADLEGRPVVDASVIEAIAKDILKTENKLLGTSLTIEELTDILKQRLSPSREQGERPIVDLRKFGAFPCWEYLNGDAWTCYPSGSGHTRIRHRDGYAIWSAMSLNETLFTRTPPSPTLPPEQERLVGPIADHFKLDREELKRVMATCAGG